MPPKEIEAKKRRTRADYVFHQEYRTRWYVHPDQYPMCQTGPRGIKHTITKADKKEKTKKQV